MFYHSFIYSLRILLKNKMLLFWTFAFPILLGIFFNMAFSDIEKKEKLKTINIAIVESTFQKDYSSLKKTMEELKNSESKEKIFNIKSVDLESAKKLLKEKKITGYLYLEDKVNIRVNQNGINETILRYTTDEIIESQNIVENTIKKEIETSIKEGRYPPTTEELENNIQKLIATNQPNIKDTSNKKLSYTMIEYYTLIAMACLYGGILSMFITNYHLANMNSVGKRIATSPLQKGKMLLGSLFSSYLVQLLGVSILLMFTVFILKVDYGNNLLPIILLTCCGSLAGLSLGVAVATLIKKNENTKTGVLIALTMLGCFLSGMMGITMKYVIDKNIPLLNKINPASMITDGFYALYYYDTPNRFLFNIISLLIFSLIMILISLKGLRRQKYDSI